MKAVDCMVYLSDDRLAAASVLDSKIRVYNIQPNKLVSVVADHGDSIQQMALSREGAFLASCGDDCMVKFWNVSNFFGFKLDFTGEAKDNLQAQEESQSNTDSKRKREDKKTNEEEEPNAKKQKIYKPKAYNSQKKLFFADL